MTLRPRVRVRALTTHSEFARVSDQWDELVRQMHRPSPFMLSAWLDAWWANHRHERNMLVMAAFDGKRLVAGVPLEIERRLRVSVAHLMGRHHAALGDILSLEDRGQAAQLLLNRIRASPVDWIDFFGPAAGGVLLGTARPNDVVAIRRVDAPVLEMAGGWDEAYRRKVSGKKRNLHRRRRRQLEEQGRLSISLATTVADLGDALEESFRLHDLRWHGRTDTSEFTTDTGKAFHRAAARNLAAEGVARILLLRLDDVPIAFHYGMQFRGVFFNHRLAFDPAFGASSPGLVATLAALEAAAADGATRVEFLGGDERYKLELADGTEPLYQCVGLASGPLGKAGAALTVAATHGRLRLKRSRRLQQLYLNGFTPVREAVRHARDRTVR